jgi:hypothetical protein
MFYKLLNEETKEYSYGPYVHAQEYMLLNEMKDSYTYPIDGWHWFDTEEEARIYFNITETQNQ